MKIVVGITGASGAIYANRLLDFLQTTPHEIANTLSKNGRQIFSDETGSDVASFGYKIYEPMILVLLLPVVRPSMMLWLLYRPAWVP